MVQIPITFDGCSGILNFPNDGLTRATGIVLCRSWGFDELCTRKYFRQIAEMLCANGYPVLRFDYLGTVDSLDKSEGENLDDWVVSTNSACEILKARTDCSSIALIGLGVGGLIASIVVKERADISGLVLAAPITNGRRYLREISLRARMIAEGLGLEQDALPKDKVSIGGLVMPDTLCDALKATNLQNIAVNSSLPALVFTRDASPSDQKFADHLATQGCSVTIRNFHGYNELMVDPTSSKIPLQTLNDLQSWICEQFPLVLASPRPVDATSFPTTLETDEFRETGLVLREQQPLYGVLCQPRGCKQGPVLVFLNSGYDHHGGWARNWVKAARALASQGFSSLRFDFSNVGDSPPRRNEPEQVLYTNGPINDVSNLLDELSQMVDGPIILVGRCSGAFTGFHAGHHDPRVKGLALINQVRFIWDPEESITDAARMGPRPMEEYKKKFIEVGTLKRLITGDIDVRGVLRGLFIHGTTRLSHLLAPVFPTISKYARFRTECHKIFFALNQRNVPLFFLCSEGDESLEQLELYFGKGRKGLTRYPTASVTVLANTDHNLTPQPAQAELIDFLSRVAKAV
ncbi:alpha/beta fold hydrolase [uncultured Roseibium sp.]|uniref:alpha/beta fold hydrolase n=1 Tax=uncultured Roseibium sp. TaxID=1936171 RepID=UPI0025999F15|nr:alpha/beta fold hydrolase [uncultured Roseibium sp.]